MPFIGGFKLLVLLNSVYPGGWAQAVLCVCLAVDIAVGRCKIVHLKILQKSGYREVFLPDFIQISGAFAPVLTSLV